MKPIKNGPRPLPTLTHIVRPVPTLPVQVNNTADSVDRVVERLLPLMEERIRVLLEQVLREQKSAIAASFRTEIEAMLEDAATAAVSQNNRD